MAVSERARTLLERGEDLFLHEERPYGRIAAAQSLRYCHQVGTCSFLLAGMQRAGAPHSAHHLVEDEQDVMPIADIADTLEIARHGRNGAYRRADHGLGNEGNNVLRAKLVELRLEFPREALAIFLRRLVAAALAIFVDRCDMRRLDEKRSELFALPGTAA